MTTALGIPKSRFAFAYVDELLACFTTHPQKSTQQVFQRLLITAGREVDAVSEHIARVLLTSIGYGESTPGFLSESAGSNLFKLIVRYGMEEVTGRNETEMQGATNLLLYLAEIMSEHLSLPHSFVGSAKFYRRVNKAASANTEGEEVCKNDCFQHLILDEPHLQAGFATLLTVINELEPLVDQLIEDGLSTMVDEYQARATRYPLRVEFLQTIVHCFLKSKMPTVCPLAVCRLINSVVQDTTREPLKLKRPLQPLLFNLIAKKKKVNANLSLEKLFYQAADVVRKGCTSLAELEYLIGECRAYRLTHALMTEAGKLTHTPAGCKEFLQTEIPKIFLTPDAIANAIIAMITSDKRIGAPTKSETGGRLPWSPSILARALTEYNNMTKEKWAMVFTELDQPDFRFVSEAGIIFIIQFFEATSFGFPMYYMFKKWTFVDGQLDFFERVIRKREGGFIDLMSYTASNLSCLERNPNPDFLYCNMRCLELYAILLTLEYTNPGCKSRIQDIFDYMISQYPEVFFVSMLQQTTVFTDYNIPVMLMSLEPLVEKLHEEDDPKHLRRILKYAVSYTENECMDHEVTCRSVASLIIRQNQMHFMTSAPRKLEFTQRCLKLMHDVDKDIIKYALGHCDMESTFELALVCQGLGFCDFDEYLKMRLALEEKQLLRFLVKELKNKKFFGYTSTFAEKVTHFLQENVSRLKLHDLEPPSFLKPVPKPVPAAAVIPPKKKKLEAKKEKKTKVAKIEQTVVVETPKQDIFDETLIEIDPSVLPEGLAEELASSSDQDKTEIEKIPTKSTPSSALEPAIVTVEIRPEPEKKSPSPSPKAVQKPLPTVSAGPSALSSSKLGPPPGFGVSPKITSESGKSPSVSSTSGILPRNSPQKPTTEPRMQRPFGNNSQAPFNPLNNYMQQQPAQSAASVGLGNIFGSASFGGSQESIRPPGSQIFGSNSPTNQSRPGMPPAPQRQNSSSSWNIPSSATRSTGPPTPLQLDFRGQAPPMQEFQRSSQPMPIFDQDLSQMQFTEDVQEEANGYFEAIYTNKSHLMTVSSLIDRLKGCKQSADNRDHKLLACVVKNLFEEYKFFNDYPDRELRITAELYGGIIREGIINETSNLHFATAVRKVIESLQQPLNSNLYTFGLVALENCRNKLCTYPKVCSMIHQLENFPRFPRSIQEHIQAGMSGDISRLSINAIPDTGSGRSTPPVWSAQAARSTTDSRNSTTGSGAVPQNRTGNNVLSYTNVDTLVKATESEGAEVAQPAEAIVDKMSFLFNNLSQTNMGAKKEEVLGLIADHGEPFIRWLAQYIVMKRVSIEQNFQPLYNTFVQVLDHPLLDVHIKKETFRNIRILLRSDKRQAASNYSDRQLLKNLGMWLGAITIARSKPILLNELDLKSLLLEAYYKGQQELLFVVPFIAKILLSCSKTPIFGASCSWIKSILKVLAELHNEPDLKINLKFEIEVLCKELSVDLQSLPIEGVLKDTEKLVHLQQQLSEIKLLTAPNQFPSSSPIPRTGVEALAAPGTDTKPSTPQPESDNAGPEPVQQSHFAYQDINVISYEGLTPHLQIKSNLPLFQLHPHLKHVVRPSLTVAIKELIGPVSERAQKIAMTVTENLIRKDFALDPNEKNLKVASFHMMRAMTAGMAMITCRDPLAVTMANSLQNAFSNALRNSVNTADSAKMIEEAAQVITAENIELATNFIVKTACEKAASEMEKRLEPEFQKRIVARQAGKPYVDEAAQAIQSLIPDPIAFQAGETPKDLMDIYMQFSTRICGFKPSVSEDLSPEAARPLILTEERTNDHLAAQLSMIIKEVDNTMGAQPNVNNKAYQAVGIIRDLLSQLAMNPRDSGALGNVIGKSVEHFLHAFHVDPSTKNPLDVEWPRRLRDLFIGVTRLCLNLTTITEIARKITSTIINLNIDHKWNVEAIEVLYKHSLIQTNVFDQHIAVKMSSGASMDQAAFFAQRLYRVLTTPETRSQFQAAFPNTYEQLVKITQMVPGRVPVPGEPQGLNSPLLENSEPVGEHELSQKVVETVLREWITICYTPAAQRSPQDALSSMIHVMHDHGCLSTDEKVSSFFKTCTEMCVDVTIKMQRNDPGTSAHHSAIIRQRCYYTLDAYVKLIALMIKYSDGNQTQTKITLLKKILTLIGNVLTMDHETRGKDFNAMPYHRILITLFNELTTPDGTALDQLQWSVMESFGQTLFLLQPRRVPGFTYAWLDIVGHRNVIGKLLSGPRDNPDSIKMQAMYTQLIICHLKFMSPFLRNIQMTKHVQALYKGTLRVLLVILHDFPELLCEFHYVICDTIPANCVQLRNIVLSAYPREMRLPDPFALNFKQVDTIADMAQEPKSNLNMSTIIPESTRVALDDYLTNRTNVDFLTTLPNLLQVSQNSGQKYNTTVLNAVVLYVGIKAIESLHQKRLAINIQTIAHTSYMDVFQNLAVQLCTEGRYLLFNAIANQLRYPNAHTHYFSCVFLFLFLNSDYDAIQEQITRILFERLVALRPHPWGLLITFIELIKNPVYNFWKFEFTRCAPEIERLFQNVANTCVPSSSRNPNESANRA